MNNNYLLTAIANNLGIFEPKNFLKQEFITIDNNFSGNTLYFKSIKIKENKQYLFIFYIEDIVFENIVYDTDGYIITLIDNTYFKEFSELGKVSMLDKNDKIVEFYYEFIEKYKIKIKTNIELKQINKLTYIDTCNHSGVYLVKNHLIGKKIESLNLFNDIYSFKVYNSPFIYYKTNEEDVIKEDKIDEEDPSIVYVYPTVSTMISSGFDDNYTNSQTYINTIIKIVTAIKINNESLEGAEDLQYYTNFELPIIIDTILKIDKTILGVAGIRVVKGEPVFNNGINIFYELSIEVSEVVKSLTSPKLNDCLFYEIK